MISSCWASGNFFQQLLDVDRALTEAARAAGCPHCGGRLARADYPRKVRGIPAESEPLFEKRLSLCCDREGCRRRLTPVSVRFFGRRVYAGAIFVMASVMRALTVPARTARRWGRWWVAVFPETPFWRVARARLMPPVDETRLPGSLLERFEDGAPDDGPAVLALLRFVAPLSSVRASFAMGP